MWVTSWGTFQPIWCGRCVQVGQRAGEIAKELGLRSNIEAQVAGQGNTTSAPWMNLNFFTQNGSEISNSTRLAASDVSDDIEERQAALAALDRYQQLENSNATEEIMPEQTKGSSPNSLSVLSALQLSSDLASPGVDLSRTQSRAQRAGSRPEN